MRGYNEENFVSSLYPLIQSSTLKKCIEHCLTALATLLHVNVEMVKIVWTNVFSPNFWALDTLRDFQLENHLSLSG